MIDQLDIQFNPLTGQEHLPDPEKCEGGCQNFYEFRIAGVGIEERCCACNFHRRWVEKFQAKSQRKKKPQPEPG